MKLHVSLFDDLPVNSQRQIACFQKTLEEKLAKFVETVRDSLEKGLKESIQEGAGLAGRSSANVAGSWHNYHPASYTAAARRGGVNPNSTRGVIHWPNELSKPCYDAFQPKWMEVFGNQLPKMYDLFEKIIVEATDQFHDQMAQRLPQINLEDIRAGANINGYLQKVRSLSEHNETMLKRDFSEEVMRNVAQSMKQPFEECKGIRGRGCFAVMKGHIDSSVGNLLASGKMV